ncbi:YqzE family protein [Virgibacillus alimentarius]|uniref:YqzE family protein n=1 Tax=Virgibacillus alimentarius TaxID=698769 RepID=UPI001D039016|nr:MULTISPECIES: YqzE family protein [Virgibacillus]HLR66442.1 YqzE family protein [Virgibacillus sp.]
MIINKRVGFTISGSDYIKYLTQQLTIYMNLPANERKKRKSDQKHDRPLYSNRWLGMVPFVLKTLLKKAK